MVEVKFTFFGALVRTTGERSADLEASTLGEAFTRLIAKHGKRFEEIVYDETGSLRRFINVYVNGRDVRFLNHLDTALKKGDNISIIPAVSGG